MSDITSLYNNSELALAAFASLQVGGTNTASNVAELIGENGARMSLTQATEFARRYPTVATQFNDSLDEGGANTGFSVTVFKDPTGNLTVAFRGVDKLSLGAQTDFLTSLDIAEAGAGYDQIVAMANWWVRASAPAGQMVQQFRLATYSTNAVPADAVVLRSDDHFAFVLEAAAQASAFAGDRNIRAALGADPDGRVELTGQSLGGHLSMAFSSLFPMRTGGVTVFNTPGFVDNAVNQAFFLKLGGSIPTGSIHTGSIVNVAADEALMDSAPFNWIAGRHSRPGLAINFAIENQSSSGEPAPFGSLNHSIATLTDSLAIYNLLKDLDPSLSPENYKVILNRAAQGTAGGYERIIDALQALFGVDSELLKIGNSQREALYEAIYDLRNPTKNPLYESLSGFLQIRVMPIASAELLSLANSSGPQGLAYRYALRKLDSFVVLGDNAGALYTSHNAEGELDLYDPVTDGGTLTSQWLQDRADFLERKLHINSLDLESNYQNLANANPDPAPGSPAHGYQMEGRRHEDRATEFVATSGPNPNSLQHIVFGTDGADVVYAPLNGREDWLYGGAGADFLAGHFGTDYLEGGAGLDVYQFYSGNAADTVLDTDGKGLLTRNGGLLALGVKTPGDAWQLGGTTYTRAANGTDLEITFQDTAADKITVRNFDFAAAQAGGYLGIRLLEALPSVPANPANTFFGDKADWDSNDAQDGVQAQMDALGNTIRADGLGSPSRPNIDAPGRQDAFTGSTLEQVERFSTGGGNDVVHADGQLSATSAQGGRDLIETGAQRDSVLAGAGEDWVEGGTEGDYLFGNAGDDVLYADTSIGQTLTVAQAIAAGASAGAAAGLQDLVSGDGGNDVIISSAGSDYLAGGEGRDVIAGGGGDDTIYGDRTVTSVTDNWATSRHVDEIGGTGTYSVVASGLTGSDAGTGGADVIYAGAGDDWVFGSVGDDFVDAGSGLNVVLGEAGNDILIGGADRDILDGDSVDTNANGTWGDDYLDGAGGVRAPLLRGHGDGLIERLLHVRKTQVTPRLLYANSRRCVKTIGQNYRGVR